MTAMQKFLAISCFAFAGCGSPQESSVPQTVPGSCTGSYSYAGKTLNYSVVSSARERSVTVAVSFNGRVSRVRLTNTMDNGSSVLWGGNLPGTANPVYIARNHSFITLYDRFPNLGSSITVDPSAWYLLHDMVEVGYRGQFARVKLQCR